MEADKFRHKEDKATVGDLIKRLSLIAGVALPLVIATATDWHFSWATSQFVQLISREIPETGRIAINLRLPLINERHYPLWLHAGILGQCGPERGTEFNGFQFGLDDRDNLFFEQIDHFPSFDFTCRRP